MRDLEKLMLIWFKLILLKVSCKIPRTLKIAEAPIMVMAKAEEMEEEEVKAEGLRRKKWLAQ